MKSNKKKTNILLNQQFNLGTIINPNSTIKNFKVLNNIDDENIKCNKSIDVFFGEKPPSPILSNKTYDRPDNRTDNRTDNIQTTNSSTIQTETILNTPQDIKLYEQSLQTNNLNIINPIFINKIFTNSEIKLKIEKLSENELYEIFTIIKHNNEKYSVNKNGIFINISSLKQITIKEICNFIIYCENNNKIFDKEEQIRDIYREFL